MSLPQRSFQRKAAKPSATLATVLHKAMDAHQDGEIAQARLLYQQVLKRQPRHPDALHLLGVLEAQSGESARGAQLIQRALLLQPNESMFHNNMGNVLVDLGMSDKAETAYARAVELDPKRAEAMNNLAVLLGRRRLFDEAEALLQQVIREVPGFFEARSNLANLYLNLGRAQDAALQCEQALDAQPADDKSRRALASAHHAMGAQDKLIAVYRDWLAADPGNAEAAFHLRAWTGEGVPERAPDDYVVSLFDSFSRSFDASLARLDYQAPQQVAAALGRCVGAPARACDIVDAGCGTGLVGPLVQPWARRLVGVDLSPGMLRKAAARRVYDALEQGELVSWLDAHPASCDALLAADTLIYFGVLHGFAAAARRAVRPGGWLIFTLEAQTDEAGKDYELHGYGRYSHRRGYVQAALQGAGWTAVDIQAHVPRNEAGQPVAGWMVCARADADVPATDA